MIELIAASIVVILGCFAIAILIAAWRIWNVNFDMDNHHKALSEDYRALHGDDNGPRRTAYIRLAFYAAVLACVGLGVVVLMGI